MLRCKHVSDALAKKNFRDLTWLQRIGAIIHVVLCPLCGKFNRDIIKMQETTREFSEKDPVIDTKLSAAARDRIEKSIQESLDDR